VRAAGAVAAVGVLVGAVLLVDGVRDWNGTVERALPGVRANVWVAELSNAAGRLDRDRRLPVSYVAVTAGEYVDAVGRIGSPLTAETEVFEGDVALETRQAADRAVIEDFRLAPQADALPPSWVEDESCGDPVDVGPGSGPVDLGARERLRVTAGDADVTVGVAVTAPVRHASDAGVVPARTTMVVGDPTERDRHDFHTFVVFFAPATVETCLYVT